MTRGADSDCGPQRADEDAAEAGVPPVRQDARTISSAEAGSEGEPEILHHRQRWRALDQRAVQARPASVRRTWRRDVAREIGGGLSCHVQDR